MRLPPTTQSMD